MLLSKASGSIRLPISSGHRVNDARCDRVRRVANDARLTLFGIAYFAGLVDLLT
jgi:hypothetical protein